MFSRKHEEEPKTLTDVIVGRFVTRHVTRRHCSWAGGMDQIHVAER